MADEQTTNQELSQEQAAEVAKAAEAAAANAENAGSGDEGNEDVPAEVLREKLTAANKQAAAERVRFKAAEAAKEELQARLAEVKTMDEVNAIVADYEKKLADSNLEADRYRAALAAGLPETMVARVMGDNFDSMLEDAKGLAELLGKAPAPELRTPGGGRDPREKAKPAEPGAEYRAARAKHQH